MNIIVAHIDELRKIKGMTKTEMADKSGISRSSVNNWFYADAIPSLSNIESICNAFNITVEQFFSGIGKAESEKSELEFIDAWRMMGDKERTIIKGVIETFKELRQV